MDFKSISNYLKTILQKDELDEKDLAHLNELLEALKKENEIELKTCEERRILLDKETSPEAMVKTVNQQYSEYRKLAMGNEKINVSNPALKHKLIQLRWACWIDIITLLLAFPVIFISHIFYSILIISSLVATFFEMKLKNKIKEIVTDEVKKKIDNSAYAHNYVVSVKKSCIYEQLIHFIEALIAKKDEKSLLQIQQQLDNIINMAVEEIVRKTQCQETQKMDIQSLKKFFHVK